MKKYIFIILVTGLSLVLPTSCLKEYLDKAPEQGLTDDQVFGKYDNFKLFFDAVYEGRQYFSGGWYDYNIKTAMPLYFDMWDQKYSWEGLTDAADQGRYMEGHNFKSGSVSAFISKFTYDGKRRPILSSMFTDIRICNIALKNLYYLESAGVDQVEIDDFHAQALFVRAFCHFELMRLWGPMPYLTSAIGATDPWDIKRMPKHAFLMRIAQDFDSAAFYFNRAGRMRRDPLPGLPNHLGSPDQRRPTGVAAKAFRARALLYAASPLNNGHGVADWDTAAVANWDALQIALSNGYTLLDSATMKTNFVGANYTNEELWGYNHGTQSWNSGNFQAIMPSMFVSTSNTYSGVMPTQNFVDRYETKWGEPLNTQAERDAAILAGHYNDQNPYINRDARFYQDIIYNQSLTMPGWTANRAQIWYKVVGGVTTYSELQQFSTYLGVTRTGYYLRKYSWGNSSKSTTSQIISDPLIRLAELYLNYAEAASEAYGGASGTAPGATLSAEQALNVIRLRAKQPVITTGLSPDAFRLRVKNEICVEFAYEGHYYHDIRRWMDAPAAYTNSLIGMDIEQLQAPYDALAYPTGYRHIRKALPSDRQVKWKEPMYYLPFETADNFKMREFVPNVVW
jgi:hypothetical protein